MNPILYRGYYYDSDISLYVLGTRYYDPATGRFINADNYISTGQGLLGNNMFAYCKNNPIKYVDPMGNIAVETAIALGIVLSVALLLSAAILSLPTSTASNPGLGGISDAESDIDRAKLNYADSPTKSIAIPKAEEKDATLQFPEGETIIYRYRCSKDKNLAPRPGRDYDGLSFSTIPPTDGREFVVTTIERVNSTGILTATKSGTHVVITPTNGTVYDWMSQGMNSVWTENLASVVIEWE